MGMVGPLSPEEIDEKMKIFAPMMMKENNVKSLLSKDFSTDNPRSDIMAVVFQTTRAEDVINSIIVENNGKFEEQELEEPISSEEHNLLRKQFA